MRARISIFALLLLATLAVSCRKEAGTSRSGIVFQARSTSFVEPDTRTVFSGVSVETGDNKKTERIDWVEGDLIRVYCAEASLLDSPSTHFSDYTVTGQSSGGATCTATITSSAGNGLQWGSGSHTFYAMYPSPSTEGLSGVTFNNGTMVLTIPATQTVTRKGTTGTWLPDMRYAPMLAKTTAETTEGSVGLDFAPQYSAFTFTVGLGAYESLSLTGFTLTSTTGNLTGKITVNASDYGTATVSGGGKSITIDLTGMTLNASNPSATFTVLAVPEETSGLQVSFTGEQIGTRTLALNRADGTPLTFQAYKKYNLGGFTFPVLVDGSVDDPIDWDHNVSVSDYMSWYSLARVGEGLNWDNVRIALSSTADAYLWSGGTLTRTVSARDGIGAPYTDVEVYWASSATGVAKVDAVTGVVTAVAPGTATITAYAYPADGSTPLTASYTVYVNAVTEIALEIDQTEILPGNTATLTATFTHTTNGTVSAYPTISFVSGNTSIATVSPATPTPVAASESTATVTSTATAVGPGLVTLTVKSSSGYTTSVTELSASVDLKVLIPGSMGGYYLSRGVLEATGPSAFALTSGNNPFEMLDYYWNDARRNDGTISSVTHHFTYDELGNYFANGVIATSDYIGSFPTTESGYKIVYDNSTWVVPSMSQWEAIRGTDGANRHTRPGSVVNGVTGCLWAAVVVNLEDEADYVGKGLSVNSSSPGEDIGSNYIAGLLLIPDYGEFDCPSLTSFNSMKDYPNSITAAELRALCAGTEGCVFLASIGYGQIFQGWAGQGISFGYWTSTADPDSTATACCAGGGGAGSEYIVTYWPGDYLFRAVRLIREY